MGKLLELNNTKFKVRNVSDKKAEILIYDQIGFDFWGDGVTAKSFADELSKVDKKVNLIEVRVNSPGGDVFDGYTIYNRLKQHSAEVHVYIDGLAASIASIIALAGDKVFMAETSQFMIHKPSVFVGGDSRKLMDMIERLDAIEDQLISVYRKKTGLTETELKGMLADETWFNPDEAFNLGFVDEVVSIGESEKFAACAKANQFIENSNWIRNKHQLKISAEFKEKVNNLSKEIKGFLAR